ncbi:MAG: DUF3052 family protein [Planctomycetes bacterium]|nr:DUF3052 family protein [Planctomycetota bacterium]
MPAGYSGTPLWKKLGLAPGFRVKLVDPPPHYERLVAPLPDGITLSGRLRSDIDLVHAFTRSRTALARGLPRWSEQIRRDGTIWVSWPKRASGVPTDVTEDVVRELALPLGLVDVKVCAVDDTWSGLKLVIRKELR